MSQPAVQESTPHIRAPQARAYRPPSLLERFQNNRNALGWAFMLPATVLLVLFLTCPLGLGTWRMTDSEATASVRDALGLGYRLIDTAAIYGNETGVGRGVQASGIKREEVFITTKVWNDRQGDVLHGVLQIINNKSDQPFGDLEVEGASQLCKTLATAIRQRMQKADESQRRRATRYDGLVADGVLTTDELQQVIQKAREDAKPVEHVLMADYQIRPSQIGPSLAKFFGVQYEPFNSGRIRSEQLQGPLKRDFVEEQGWIPLEESPEGLVVMCVDPEAVRGSRMVPQVFSRLSKFSYRVTTQTEFEETVAQLYGAGEGASIDELLADMNAPMDEGDEDGSSLESAAADNELVKFVNKVIIDAYNQKVSDIHIEPLPGKALMNRWSDSTYCVNFSTAQLPPGRYSVRLVAKGPAAAWSFTVR